MATGLYQHQAAAPLEALPTKRTKHFPCLFQETFGMLWAVAAWGLLKFPA